MEDTLLLLNTLKECRAEKKMSQAELADAVGVSRNTISSIETGQYAPTAKLAYSLCLALDKQFEELFYFDGMQKPKNESASNLSFSDKKINRLIDYLTKKGWDSAEILSLIRYLTSD